MNIQRKNSAHHFRMQSEREQTLVDSELIHADLTKAGSVLVESSSSP